MSAPLAGRRVLVTAGPTYEDLDPVRFLGNRSSGKMGFAIAEAAVAAGADVVLIAGPVHLSTPHGVQRIDVRSAAQMREAVFAAFPADVYIGHNIDFDLKFFPNRTPARTIDTLALAGSPATPGRRE